MVEIPTTRICLVRHGETEWNTERRIQGHIDIGLNETGLRQAALAGRWLRDAGIAAVYGSDLTRAWVTAQTIAAALGLSPDAPTLAVLPGSRLGEIGRLAPVSFEAARRVAAQVPGLQIVIPAANAACRQALEAQIAVQGVESTWHLLGGRAREAMIASDAVLLASGTATLEAMLCKRPMVVGYRIAPLTYRIVKGLGLLKVERYALPNVLAGETLVPELLQDDCTPANLHAALRRWFLDADAVAALQPTFLAMHQSLRRDASARAADAVAGLLATPA